MSSRRLKSVYHFAFPDPLYHCSIQILKDFATKVDLLLISWIIEEH